MTETTTNAKAPRQAKRAPAPAPTLTIELTANRVTAGGYHVADMPGKPGKTTPVYFSPDQIEAALDPKTGVATFVVKLTPKS